MSAESKPHSKPEPDEAREAGTGIAAPSAPGGGGDHAAPAAKPHISPEVEEAQARLWEFIHESEDPDKYDQANADLDAIYSALIGFVEQLEAAQDALRAICEPYGEGRRYVDIIQIARDALNPATRSALTRPITKEDRGGVGYQTSNPASEPEGT